MSTQSIVVKPDENMKIIVGELQKGAIQQQIGTALAGLSRWITPEKMIRVAMTAIRGDEKLAMSTPVSIIGSVIQLAQVGLVPDGFLGQAYLVPYWNKEIKRYEASPLIGYRGYGELAVRSGKATSVDAHTIYEGDLFEYEYGTNPFIKYQLQMNPKKRGPIIGAYAIVYMKEGPHRFEIMPIDQIDKVKGSSQGADSSYSPWKQWYEEMVRKTPMRRLAKWVPLSQEFQLAAGIDEASEMGLQKTVIDSATGQVLFISKEHVSEEPAKPGRTSDAGQGGASSTTQQTATGVQGTASSKAPAAAKSEASGSPSQPQRGEAPLPQQGASPDKSGCICNCCKRGSCDCPGKEEMEQCGCTPCMTFVKTPGPSASPSLQDIFNDEPTQRIAEQPVVGEVLSSEKPAGPYVPQEKLRRLFVHAASAGIVVEKDSHDDQLHKLLKAKWNIDSIKEIPQAIFEEVLEEIAPQLKAAKAAKKK